jgi:hypothetical protein
MRPQQSSTVPLIVSTDCLGGPSPRNEFWNPAQALLPTTRNLKIAVSITNPILSHTRSLNYTSPTREIGKTSLGSIVSKPAHLCTKRPFQPRLLYAILPVGLLNASAFPESHKERPL